MGEIAGLPPIVAFGIAATAVFVVLAALMLGVGYWLWCKFFHLGP